MLVEEPEGEDLLRREGGNTKECFPQEVTFALGEEVRVGVPCREVRLVRPQGQRPFSISKYDWLCLHSSHLPDPGNIAVFCLFVFLTV